MRQRLEMLKREDGSVMVVGLLVLVMASLIGIAASTTSTIEVEVAGNDKTYKQNFYRAEGAAVLAAQLLENERDATELNDLPYGQPDPDNPTEPVDQWFRYEMEDLPYPDNIGNHYNWDSGMNYSGEALCDTNRYLAFLAGVDGSLDLGGSRLHSITIYGRSEMDNGSVIVEVGYKKRY
jgi:type IV pilus assembly protein PilX